MPRCVGVVAPWGSGTTAAAVGGGGGEDNNRRVPWEARAERCPTKVDREGTPPPRTVVEDARNTMPVAAAVVAEDLLPSFCLPRAKWWGK